MQTSKTKKETTPKLRTKTIKPAASEQVRIDLSTFEYNDTTYCRVDFIKNYRAQGRGIVLTIDKWNALIENCEAIGEFMEAQGVG